MSQSDKPEIKNSQAQILQSLEEAKKAQTPEETDETPDISIHIRENSAATLEEQSHPQATPIPRPGPDLSFPNTIQNQQEVKRLSVHISSPATSSLPSLPSDSENESLNEANTNPIVNATISNSNAHGKAKQKALAIGGHYKPTFNQTHHHYPSLPLEEKLNSKKMKFLQNYKIVYERVIKNMNT